MGTIAAILAVALQVFLPVSSYKVQDNGSNSGACSFGTPVAPVRIEVFSDYQCPACRENYLGTILPLANDPLWSRRICVVYRDVPLKKHPYAREASRYARAALLLGQAQWRRISDTLYTEQGEWSASGNIEVVVGRALAPADAAKIKTLVRLASIDQFLDEEIAFANRNQIRSVPTIFIHSRGKEDRIVGTVPYAILREYLGRIGDNK